MVNTERWRHRGPRAWTGAECGAQSGEWRVHSSDDRFLGGQPAPALPAPLPRASCTLQPSTSSTINTDVGSSDVLSGRYKKYFLPKFVGFSR